MASQDLDSHGELFVHDEADTDIDQDNYVRHVSGPIHLVHGESEVEEGCASCARPCHLLLAGYGSHQVSRAIRADYYLSCLSHSRTRLCRTPAELYPELSHPVTKGIGIQPKECSGSLITVDRATGHLERAFNVMFLDLLKRREAPVSFI